MMLSRRDLNEHEGERSKDHRLNQSNEHLQEHKRQWRPEWQQVGNNHKQDFTGKDITEQTE